MKKDQIKQTNSEHFVKKTKSNLKLGEAYAEIVLYFLFPSSLNSLIPRFKVVFLLGGKSQFKMLIFFSVDI